MWKLALNHANIFSKQQTSPYAEVESVVIFCPLNHFAPSSTIPFDDPKNRGWTSGGVVGPLQMTFKVNPFHRIWP